MREAQKKRIINAIEVLERSEAFIDDTTNANFHSLWDHFDAFKKVLEEGRYDEFES